MDESIVIGETELSEIEDTDVFGVPMGHKDAISGHPSIADNDQVHFYLEKGQEAPDNRPASEKLAALFDGMPGRHDVLMCILRGCFDPRNDETVLEMVEKQQASNRSVYEAHTLCSLLEKAGGLLHVLGDGSLYNKEDYEPVVVNVDGEEFIQAAEPPLTYWVTTDEGRAFVEADNPAERTRLALAAEPESLPLFKFLLTKCQGEGASTPALQGVIDEHPLSQNPRRYTQHYLKILEDASALVWNEVWHTTEAGAEVLCGLAGVEDIA